jgi:hypothetical protein
MRAARGLTWLLRVQVVFVTENVAVVRSPSALVIVIVPVSARATAGNAQRLQANTTMRIDRRPRTRRRAPAGSSSAAVERREHERAQRDECGEQHAHEGRHPSQA